MFRRLLNWWRGPQITFNNGAVVTIPIDRDQIIKIEVIGGGGGGGVWTDSVTVAAADLHGAEIKTTPKAS